MTLIADLAGITPTVGMHVQPDDWMFGALLEPGEPYVDTGFRGCQFRLPTNTLGPIKSLAVDVTVTGRTVQWHNGGRQVRVRITFVGDCEPDKHTHGWLSSMG